MKQHTVAWRNSLLVLFITLGLIGIDSRSLDAIEPDGTNPRYWNHNGQPVVLIGGSGDDNLFQWSGTEVTNHLDTLASVGGNYVRNTMSDRDGDDLYPFHRRSDGLYDLNRWNSAYWDRFDTFLQETADRGIFVEIELWDEWDFGTDPYEQSPWNPKNNVNYSASETILNTSFSGGDPANHNFFETVPADRDDALVRSYQEAFINKVLSISLQYDHVLYTMMNESRASRNWSLYWAHFVQNNSGKTVYRAPMRDPAHETITEVTEHPDAYEFADVSQTSKYANQNHADAIIDAWNRLASIPRPLNSTKQYGAFEDLSWSPEHEDEGAARCWRSILLGQASVRFHRPTSGLGLNQKAQNHIRALRHMVERVKPWTAKPHQQLTGLLSDREDDEAYLMADPDRIYALYFPGDNDGTNDEPVHGDGTVDLDVSGIDGTVRIQWYNVEANNVSSETTSNGGTVTLTRPNENHWLVLIEAVESPSVRIVRPSDGATYTEPADLGVVADASDADGTVNSVDLSINGNTVRTETASPYEWGTANSNETDAQLLGLSAGRYTLEVVATDDDGRTGSDDVTVTVEADVQAEGPEDGTYVLKARHSGKCLDVSGVSLSDGASLQQWDCHGGENQQFQLKQMSDGTYRVTAVHSGKVMDVYGASADNGADVIQWSDHGGDNQRWNITSVGDGYVRITAKHSGNALDVSGISQDNGANVQQWEYWGGSNQQWALESISDTSDGSTTGSSLVTAVNFNGGAVTIDGNTWLSQSEAETQGLVTTADRVASVSVEPSPGVDADTEAMLQTNIWAMDLFSVTRPLSDGAYDVYLWVMENYQSDNRSFDVRMEGETVATAVGSGWSLGDWKRMGPYPVTISDGALNIDFVAVEKEPHVMGMEIYSR